VINKQGLPSPHYWDCDKFWYQTIAGNDYELGQLVIEGKTKQVWDLPTIPDRVLVLSKDRITAGDGVKAHDLEGKAAISNETNGKVFELLNSFG